MDKPGLRKQLWSALRAAGAARFPGVEGRIPNFVGAEHAARRLMAVPRLADEHRFSAWDALTAARIAAIPVLQ